jgi:superfamily II DNA or RNA helicase
VEDKSLTLRDYQEECVTTVDGNWPVHPAQLIVLATGGGKTRIAAAITEKFTERSKRVLFLAHREELLYQTIKSFGELLGVWPALEKAAARASLGAQIVVGSVQTFLARGARWPRGHFDLVIVDEAHHAMSDSYVRIIHDLAPPCLLGLTATPKRLDCRNLLTLFKHLAFERGMFDLINAPAPGPYLAPIWVKSLPLKIDLRGVRQQSGDYKREDLGDVLLPWLREIAEKVKEHASARRVLAFWPLIATSKKFVAECEAIGLKARHIDGEPQNKHLRAPTLEAFKAGEFNILSNSSLLGEGVDLPLIDCVLPGRPTRSETMYRQQVGRGTRLHPGKTNLLLFDFLYQCEKHLMRPSHLVAPTNELADEMTAVLSERALPADGEAQAGGESVQEGFDLEGVMSEAAARREAKLKRELEAQSKKAALDADVMQFAQAVGADDVADWKDTEDWHRAKPNAAQLATIAAAGIKTTGVKSFGHAAAIVNAIVDRRNSDKATWKQIKQLRKFGYRDPEQFSKREASEIIGKKFASWRSASTPAWEAA